MSSGRERAFFAAEISPINDRSEFVTLEKKRHNLSRAEPSIVAECPVVHRTKTQIVVDTTNTGLTPRYSIEKRNGREVVRFAIKNGKMTDRDRDSDDYLYILFRPVTARRH